jgi:hypothetical protein
MQQGLGWHTFEEGADARGQEGDALQLERVLPDAAGVMQRDVRVIWQQPPTVNSQLLQTEIQRPKHSPSQRRT